MARTARRIVVVSALLGLAARLAFGFGYWSAKPLTHDEREYLALASSLANGSGFHYPSSASAWLPEERFSRAPGYPAFLAVFGGSEVTDVPPPASTPGSIKVVQSIVGAAGVLAVAGISWRLSGPVGGAVAGLTAALYPPLVWICSYVLTEALYSTLALLTALLLGQLTDPAPHTDGPRRPAVVALGSGLLGGITALTRPPALAFLALATVWLATRRSWRHAAWLVLGALIVLGPWTARNLREYGRLIPVSAQGGVNFWIGNHPLAVGDGDLSTNPGLKDASLALRRQHPDKTPEELEAVYYRDAFRRITGDPGGWLALLARKFFYVWVPIGPSYTARSTLYRWTSVIAYGTVVAFAVPGAVSLRRRKRLPVALGLMAVAAVATSVAFFPHERFRIPILDPTFIVLASAWVAGRYRQR